MGRSSQYNHYMQRIDIGNQSVIDIEEQFLGLLYESADGIYTVGKSKNIYTEDYADSDKKRVFLPNDGVYTHEGTQVTMKFIVIGTSSVRDSVIRDFIGYITTGVHRYWDTARNREFDFIVTDEVKVSEELWHGSHPFVELTVNLQNINGTTRVHTSS